MTSKPKPALAQWRVMLIRKDGRMLVKVEARSADEAIAVAIRQFEITNPHQQKRLVAQRVG